MVWDNFYTPRDLTKELLTHIPEKFFPSHIIDICGGSGNMLIEGSIKFPKAKITYIDKSIHENILNLYNDIWDIYQFDSTNHEIINYFNFNEKKLLLANPPFGYSVENSNFKYKRFNRLEIQILDVNISILNEGDIFAAVLPENIFTSEQTSDFKHHFENNFETIYLGKPSKYFDTSEVLTRLFVGKKIYPKKNVQHKAAKINSEYLIVRGVDNSSLNNSSPVQNESIGIVHSNDLNTNSIYSCLMSDYGNKLIIDAKDLLVVRVGRNSGKVLIPSNREINKGVSDNLFILRNHKIRSKELKKFEHFLVNSKKGLTTNYITKNDISLAIKKLNSTRSA